jgi:hypothetical protein
MAGAIQDSLAGDLGGGVGVGFALFPTAAAEELGAVVVAVGPCDLAGGGAAAAFTLAAAALGIVSGSR